MDLFKYVYRGGVVGGIALALLCLVRNHIFNVVPTFLLWALLALGVCYILALALIAYKTKEGAARQAAAEKIQTAGYLYTLIGFIAALAVLNQDSVSEGSAVFNLFPPVATSLVTSILGWFLGGELSTPDTAGDEAASIRREFEKVAGEMSGFAAALRRQHEQYLGYLTDAEKQMQTVLEHQNNFFREVSEKTSAAVDQITEETKAAVNQITGVTTSSAVKIQTALDGVVASAEKLNAHFSALGDKIQTESAGIVATLRQLEEQAKEARKQMAEASGNTANLSSSLNEAAQNAKQAAEYLSQGRRLLAEMEKLLEAVANERAKK